MEVKWSRVGVKGSGLRESICVLARTHSLRACTMITVGSYACSYTRRDMSTPATASTVTPSVRRRVTWVSTHAPVFGLECLSYACWHALRQCWGICVLACTHLFFQTGAYIRCVLARTPSIVGHMRVGMHALVFRLEFPSYAC